MPPSAACLHQIQLTTSLSQLRFGLNSFRVSLRSFGDFKTLLVAADRKDFGDSTGLERPLVARKLPFLDSNLSLKIIQLALETRQ